MMLQRFADLYRHELLDRVIPFWMTHSLDREHGGYFTGLDRDGSLYDSRKYVWLNGRQVWMLSKLYNEAGRKQEWLDAARLGAEFLRKHAFDEQGRCYFSLTREGEPAFMQRKPYSAAFVALGLHEYAKATGDKSLEDEAIRLFSKVRQWIANPELLGRPNTGASQLADIYVTAFLSLQVGQPMKECLDMIEPHWDPKIRSFRENALIGSDSPEVRLFCPGSVFEIGWFLLRLEPGPEKQQMILTAMESAHHRGWDRDYGGYFYFMDVEDKPLLQLEWNMKLWWVHVEALAGFAHAYQATGDQKWLAYFEQVHEYTWSHFRDPEYGEWFGYLDRRGERTHNLKGNNYKGCFHIPRALLLCSQIFSKLAN